MISLGEPLGEPLWVCRGRRTALPVLNGPDTSLGLPLAPLAPHILPHLPACRWDTDSNRLRQDLRAPPRS
jgi:hypothetical protein